MWDIEVTRTQWLVYVWPRPAAEEISFIIFPNVLCPSADFINQTSQSMASTPLPYFARWNRRSISGWSFDRYLRKTAIISDLVIAPLVSVWLPVRPPWWFFDIQSAYQNNGFLTSDCHEYEVGWLELGLCLVSTETEMDHVC
eukprot:scpid63618/ scgid16394/ 